jgi:hypothetical protein
MTNKPIYELVYHSAAKANLRHQDLEDILSTSKTWNKANHITGFLLYHKGEFLQILEGNREAVDQLFERIKMDHRHESVLLLANNFKAKRSFPDWSMGFHQVTDQEAGAKDLLLTKLKQFASVSSSNTLAEETFWRMIDHILDKTHTPT